MHARAAAANVLLAGLPVAAQESIAYNLSWVEVTAFSSVPVANPNGQLDPGEGARVAISIQITPGIGSPVTYTPPPGPGSGTLAGLGSIFFDINATNASGGLWTNFSYAPGWGLGGHPGQTPDGSLHAGGAGQHFFPGSVANSANPVANIWRATWNPGSYAVRHVSFEVAAAIAGGTVHSAILVQYGPDPENDPQYVGKFVDATFTGVNIPVIPSPAGLPWLTLAVVGAARRRR